MTEKRENNWALNLAAFTIIIGGAIYAASILTPLLMALFLSIICAQPILWLQKKRVPQGLAIFTVFIGIVILFLGLGEMIGSSLSSFSEQAPVYEQNLNAMGASFLHFFTEHGINLSTDEMTKLFEPAKIMSITAGFLGQLGGFMGNAFTIIFLVLFLLMELDSISVKIKAIVGASTDSFSFFTVIGQSIRHYLFIKTLTSLLTGICIWICLAIMGVDYAIIWALIAFLLNYIPNIGSIIAAVPAVLFSMIQLGFGGALGTIVVFVIVNILIGNVIEPKMMGKGMGLSTFVVFFALIFWGFIFGTVGMFLSVPLTMAIKIILEQNPGTKGFAIALGTQDEAQIVVDQRDENS